MLAASPRMACNTCAEQGHRHVMLAGPPLGACPLWPGVPVPHQWVIPSRLPLLPHPGPCAHGRPQPRPLLPRPPHPGPCSHGRPTAPGPSCSTCSTCAGCSTSSSQALPSTGAGCSASPGWGTYALPAGGLLAGAKGASSFAWRLQQVRAITGRGLRHPALPSSHARRLPTHGAQLPIHARPLPTRGAASRSPR